MDPTVTANGVNITSQLSSGSLTISTTITGVTSPLTSLSESVIMVIQYDIL